MAPPLTLIVPDKADVERDRVALAWESAYGPVLRIGRFWDPPPIDPEHVRLYGNDTFCLVLSQVLGLKLVSPEDDLLVGLDERWLRRSVISVPLSAAEALEYPRFVKPVVPKQFAAAVYPDHASLVGATDGLEADSRLLVAEPVVITAEVRSFVLDGRVLTAALYEGECDLARATVFAEEFATTVELPRTAVVDLGVIGGEFAVIEANAAWGAGLNGCDADAVVHCLEAATQQP